MSEIRFTTGEHRQLSGKFSEMVEVPLLFNDQFRTTICLSPDEADAFTRMVGSHDDCVKALKLAAEWCPLCYGKGHHAPAVAWPAVPEAEDRRRRADLPSSVECSNCAEVRAALASARPAEGDGS